MTGIDAGATASAAIGAPHAARMRVRWDDRCRRVLSATREFTAANTGRARQAASTQAASTRQVALMRAALAVLDDRVPYHLAASARLRLQHPHTGMGALGKLAITPLSKDTVAGRLRRRIALADRHTTRLHTTETP
ncbi:helix-turn-helix domain-containing protein [Nocardia sp. NPDC047038]|uniref:helix-turn-helix domain-containing protein n=1 Tax=Nocardia sp. NPDC047038 TaxID=3154338 RepID=UPI0033F1EF52